MVSLKSLVEDESHVIGLLEHLLLFSSIIQNMFQVFFIQFMLMHVFFSKSFEPFIRVLNPIRES